MGVHRQGDGVRKVMRLAALLILAARLTAQPVVGARAGVVSFAIGKVYLDNQAIDTSPTHFPEVKENSVLRTEGGRAEVLLNPCAVLRVDEDSSIRMIDGDLLQPRVELLGGSAVVDVPGIRKGSEIRLRLGSAAAEMAHKGTYRFDYSPAAVKVYEGRAEVERNGARTEVPVGRTMTFDSAPLEKFDIRDGDGLDLWNHERGIVLARARGRRQLSMIDLAAAAGTAGQADAGMRPPTGIDPMIVRRGPRASALDAFGRAPLDMGCKF
jgi:ferric-dicitrate binding protein FerR (iron transport regulator)